MAKESSRQENESITVKSMEPVVVFHSTRTKNHSTCYKSFYQRRKLKNKGAIAVIVWNHLVTSLTFYLATRVPDYCTNRTSQCVPYSFYYLLGG